MRCSGCGIDVNVNETHCPKCGLPLNKDLRLTGEATPNLIDIVPDTNPVVSEPVKVEKGESNTAKIIKGIIAIVLVAIFFYLLYNLLLTRGII